jgi:hypothetical protein
MPMLRRMPASSRAVVLWCRAVAELATQIV